MSMSLDENAQVAKALVDSLSTETTTLSGVNLATLSRNDLEQLAELSQDLNLSSEMNTAEEELMETDEEIQTEAVRPELGAHEVEIETERNQSPEEIIPEIKTKTNLPPLRPLTIAPKPTRVPITLKSAGGQQLLLLQGGTAGQPLKIVSPQGQGISVTNLANLSLAKPIALRPAGKTITANNMSVLQPKQVIMKKVTSTQKLVGDGKNILITEKLDTSSKQNQNLILHTPPKTITLAQAQQMGLLAGAKFAPQVGIKQSIVNKPQAKTYKIVSQGKPQTKILPAPQTVTASKGTQRIILKPTNANSSLVSPAQLIQVSSGQPVITGQLHQINIPGKGVQYIKLMTSTASLESNVTTSTATNVSVGQIKSIEAKVVSSASSVPSKLTNVVLTEAVAGSNKALKATTINPRSSTVHIPASSQLVVLPSNFMSQPLPAAKVGIPAKPKPSASEINTAIIPDVNMEANGIRPRKPCNCTKSQCLKLYCDCFANGEFCNMCNCMNCFNNLENEEHRQRAIKSCLERNPSAFRPKIGKAKDTGDMAIRKHTKGCNCKRSGCLKNYCECYEAKIACSSNCKCVSCRNVEDSIDEKDMQSIALVPIPITAPMLSKIGSSRSILEFRPKRHVNNKHAFSYITDDVIEATCQCLLAISDRGQTNNQDEEFVKFEIIEEFGKCLKEIIECSMNRSIENEVN